MVASDTRHRVCRISRRGFNPLHCGAVVASSGGVAGGDAGSGFQSPSLRGSGRFWLAARRRDGAAAFQSPSLRGSGRFRCAAYATPHTSTSVSIPFIAGQWSLLAGPHPLWERAVAFQSPSLRGSGRFEADPDFHGIRLSCFNPLHCGAVVASNDRPRASARASVFQSPSLRGSGRFPPPHGGGARRRSCFNPLHCGAVVAS